MLLFPLGPVEKSAITIKLSSTDPSAYGKEELGEEICFLKTVVERPLLDHPSLHYHFCQSGTVKIEAALSVGTSREECDYY
jgi:hypothetical protein